MLQKISRLSFAVTIIVLLHSCGSEEQKEDAVQTVSKKASIETEVSVQHADSVDVLVTKHKVWINNNLTREIIKTDTIPALGDTIVTVDQNGTNVQQTTNKDYEFYITVQ